MIRCALLLAVAIAAIAVPSAHAAFPGTNGRIAFVSDRDGNNEIYTVNPDGSAVQRLTNNAGSDIAPEWSPGGTKIVFSGDTGFVDGDITVMNADGSGQTVVGNGVDPSWSPDGGEIAFTRLGGRDCDGGEGLYTMNADGSNVTLLTCFAIGDHRDPAWAPDGQSIVFAADFLSYDIYSIKPDGTNLSVVASTDDFEWQPDWSPDRSKIAFVSDREPSGVDYRIYTMNADGSAQTMFTPPGPSDDFFDPSWSPDGTKIAYTNFNIPNRIYFANADGTNTTLVTDGSQPDWQPIPINYYARPKGATPILASLVTAYKPCSSPDRTHGPPLAFGSCSSPQMASDHLTVGTGDSNGKPARSEGEVRIQAIVGNPANPADEADVAMGFLMNDVYTKAMVDYDGELRVRLTIQITDKNNTPHPSAPGGSGAATTTEIPIEMVALCSPTINIPDEGSYCSFSTSADTLAPGSVREGRRTIWQMQDIEVYDGGADGDADTPSGDTLFATKGLFIP